MDIIVKIKEVLQEQTFAKNDGTTLLRAGFVGVTNGQYPKTVCFQVIGQERWEKLKPYVVVGSDVQVFFDVSSREYNSKWYSQLDAYRVNSLTAIGQNSGGQQTQQPQAQPQGNSDMPF